MLRGGIMPFGGLTYLPAKSKGDVIFYRICKTVEAIATAILVGLLTYLFTQPPFQLWLAIPAGLATAILLMYIVWTGQLELELHPKRPPTKEEKH